MNKLASTTILGFDMDGVVLDHTVLKMELSLAQGYEINPNQTPSAVFRTLIPKEPHQKIQSTLYEHPVASFTSPLMEGAAAGFAQVQKWGVPYYLISRRTDGEHASKLLANQGLWPSIFNEDNAFFVDSKDAKNGLAKKLGITHYVDDSPDVLARLIDVPRLALFDPHAVFTHLSQYHRVSNWGELLVFFQEG